MSGQRHRGHAPHLWWRCAPALTPGQKIVTRPGIMTIGDLRSYVARVRAPTSVSYRGLRIDSTPPPSSRGTTVGEALNILSGWSLSTEPRATAPFHYLESSRLTCADRDRDVGDPRFVNVPTRQLPAARSPPLAAASCTRGR